MKVYLLGGVEVAGADPGQVTASSRALSLLGYLVSRPEVPQPRSHLAGVLWPDSEGAQARTNLRRELHHLRALLDHTPCLEVDQRALTWHRGPGCRVDVQDFSSAVRDTESALAAQAHDRVQQHAGRALAAYRGPFLPGCYDDWALEVREELQRACVDLCDRVATYWLEHGDPAAAVAFVRRRVLLEPFEEQGYRLLMRAQSGSGDRAGAMRTYHQCAERLERELGIGPSAETRAELDVALGGSQRARQPTPPAPEVAPWSVSPGMVGRDDERARLRSVWDAAQDGSRFLVVTGEAGVGKTRLVSDLAAGVERQGAVVAGTRCFPATGSVPLAPVADWLRTAALRSATRRLDPVWRSEVARLIPDGEAAAADPEAGLRAKVDAWQRVRFFEGLARAFLAVDAPLLLTLDDLQWCDRATLSWLSFLLSFAPAAPLLVLATGRVAELSAGDVGDAVASLRGAGQVELLRLADLDAAAAARLASAVLGRPIGHDELDMVMSATGGNPFYLAEALRELVATPGPLSPAGLRGVLRTRLSALSGPVLEVAELASAVGRDFTLDVLIEASDLDAETVVRRVDDLWRQRILTESGRGYDFSHDLLREATYDLVSPPRRWLLHRRLAQSLELVHADRPDDVAAQLAEQHDRSGRPERALPYYERAARQASVLFAHADSVRWWQRCLDIIGARPPSRQRDRDELAVLQELVPPLGTWRGYASEQLVTCERRTAELGERLGLVEVRCTAAIALFASTFVQGRTAESHAWGRQALELSAQCPGLAAQAHMACAGSGLGLGDVALADQHFRLACDLARGTDSLPIGTRTEVHARAWWAHARWLSGDEAGAVADAAGSIATARLIDHPYSLAVALGYAAVTHQLAGDRAALADDLAELTQLCERYDFAYYREWAVVLRGWVEGGPGGRALASAGVERLRREGSLARMPYWLWLVADLHRREGDLRSAAAVLDAAGAAATEQEDRWWLAEILRTRAALDPPARAHARLLDAADLATAQGSATLGERCRRDLVAFADAEPAPNG